jgi:hypothetical protein
MLSRLRVVRTALALAAPRVARARPDAGALAASARHDSSSARGAFFTPSSSASRAVVARRSR